jgi:RHS repeat-associated protein
VEDAGADHTITTFAYDQLNRVIGRTERLGMAESYPEVTFAYDAVGNLSSTTDRLGRRRDFEYDRVNRLTHERWYEGSELQQTLTFSFDAAGNLETAANAHGTHTFTYDALNRVSATHDVWNQRLTFTFDGVGNRTKVEDSFGGVKTSTYDAVNRLATIQFGGASQTEARLDFEYDKVHMRTTLMRYSDLDASTFVGSSSFVYDSLNRVEKIEHRDAAGTLVGNYTYLYDAASRVTSQVINGTTTDYGYDDTNQLTSDGGAVQTYDGVGNRTTTGYDTDPGNRLTTDGTWNYAYDEEGNVTIKSNVATEETWWYGYDHRNQLLWAEKRDAQSEGTLQTRADYKYDAFNRRIEKAVDSDGMDGVDITERYAYDGADIWADLASDSSLKTRYIRGDAIDELFARIGIPGEAGELNWLLTDRLGSLRNVTNAAGDGLLATLVYDAFGNHTTESGTVGRYTYTSRERDIETELRYNRERYYDPTTARWLTQDPTHFDAGDSNLYRYVNNSPTNATDPSGEAAPLVLGGIALLGLLFSPDYANAPTSANDRTFGKEPFFNTLQGVVKAYTAVHFFKDASVRLAVYFSGGYDAASQVADGAQAARKGEPLPTFDLRRSLDSALLSGPIGPVASKFPRTFGYSGLGLGAYKTGDSVVQGKYEQALVDLGATATGYLMRNQIKGDIKTVKEYLRRPVHIDYGGEGFHPDAMNVNISPVTTGGGTFVPGQPIPRLILIAPGQRVPRADHSIDIVTVENTTLNTDVINNIARLIRPGGEIRLHHPAPYARTAHPQVQQAVNGSQRSFTVGAGEQAITVTVIRVPELVGPPLPDTLLAFPPQLLERLDPVEMKKKGKQ